MHIPLQALLALSITYLVWGSTYLAIRFGVESFPPFMMAGARFLLAGLLLFTYLRWQRVPAPSRKQWMAAGVVGVMLLALGNGTVTYVQQTVSSGLAALTIATAPLWMALFGLCYRTQPKPLEWAGIVMGMLGIAVMSFGKELHGDVVSVCLLVFAAGSWSLGSIWSQRLPMPSGLMSSAAQMMVGGGVLLIASFSQGEAWPVSVSLRSWGAFAYLVLFGSILAYSAYLYLLKTVSSTLASSNTFVNPVVAFVLGAWLADEYIGVHEVVALLLIVVAVLLILFSKNIKES